MADYSDIIERLERADGPDRKLDFEIWFSLDPLAETDREWPEDELKMPWVRWQENYTHDTDAYPDYTASIDAAVALVAKLLPDAERESLALLIFPDKTRATLSLWQPMRVVQGDAPTPALAILLALFKALKTEDRGGD